MAGENGVRVWVGDKFLSLKLQVCVCVCVGGGGGQLLSHFEPEIVGGGGQNLGILSRFRNANHFGAYLAHTYLHHIEALIRL